MDADGFIGARYAELDTASDKDGWKILGPGGGGCVHLLTVSPHHPDTLLVSCDMTAGYITYDGGESWREFNLRSRLFAFAFDPADPRVIYAGSSGLFRSEDEGRTWRLVFPHPAAIRGETRYEDEARHTFITTDNWPGGTIRAILVDPRQPEHLLIAVKLNGLRIFASRDRGQVWKEIAALECDDVHCLFLDPLAPPEEQMLYVFSGVGVERFSIHGGPVERLALPDGCLGLRHASWGLNSGTGEPVFYVTGYGPAIDGRPGCGVWTSEDRGATWQRSARGLQIPSQDGAPAGGPLFSQVSTCQRDARTAYLIAEKYALPDRKRGWVDYHGILKTGDQGHSWDWVVRMDDERDPPNRAGGWAERDYGAAWGDIRGDEQISPKGRFAWDVVASPTNPQVCYSMDFSTIFKTVDGGAKWQQRVTRLHPDGSASSRGIDVLSCYGVMFDPFDARHLALALTDAGVFHSFNAGRTWVHALTGVPRAWINSCYWLVFDPGVRGRAWSAWAAMHDIPRSKMFRDEFLAKYQGGICRSEDGLTTWQVSNQGLPERSIVTHLLLDPDSPAGQRTLFAAVFNQGVYKSTDDGYSWRLVNAGLDPANVFAWRLARGADGTLYLVVARGLLPGRHVDGAVYASQDGESWVKLALPPGVLYPTDLIPDPLDPGRLYLTAWPGLTSTDDCRGGLHTSEDGGATWTNCFDPAARAYSLAIDPHNRATLFLATFEGGVHRSDDHGRSWRRLKGYNFQWAHRPVPDPHHAGMLYLATFGSSLWYGPAEGVPGGLEDIANLDEFGG